MLSEKIWFITATMWLQWRTALFKKLMECWIFFPHFSPATKLRPAWCWLLNKLPGSRIYCQSTGRSVIIWGYKPFFLKKAFHDQNFYGVFFVNTFILTSFPAGRRSCVWSCRWWHRPTAPPRCWRRKLCGRWTLRSYAAHKSGRKTEHVPVSVLLAFTPSSHQKITVGKQFLLCFSCLFHIADIIREVRRPTW